VDPAASRALGERFVDLTDIGPWASSALAAMSLREKVGQMLMPWVLGDFAPEGSASQRRIVESIERHGIGGVIMSVGSPMDVAVKLNDLQSRSRVPLLVAADLETGAGFRLRGAVHLPGVIDLGGATVFPSLMAVGATGDPELSYEMGRITALEARAVGIHAPFAPVLDVNNNPQNPIINVRSFGEDPQAVAEMGVAFVRGLQEHGAVATGKHFPGHGDTETDSHLALPVIRMSRMRLDSVELRPFHEAVSAGMGGVMTAHIAVPTLTGGDGVPATLSGGVLSDLLRFEMGFSGLVFTDAMDMYAIDRRFSRQEAAVRAVEAGADVLLMPPDLGAAVEGIVQAVESGRLAEERIDRSVMRILGLKERLGLHTSARVTLEDIPRTVGVRAHTEVAERIAEESITLLRNRRDLLPLRGTRTADVLSVSYRRQNDLLAGRFFNARLRQTYPRLRPAVVNRNSSAADYGQLLRRARSSDLVVVSLYVTAISYSGSVAIPEALSDFVEELADSSIPHIVISFGNPYLVTDFPDVRAYMLAWSGSEASQRAAAKALFGEIEIGGRTPTAIPPLFALGEGIQLPRKEVLGAR
jgi:beta-N-acetylhexosaminidase